MKKIGSFLLFSWYLGMVVYGQSIPRIVFGGEANIDVLKYTRSSRNYMEETGNLHSATHSFNLGYNHLFRNKVWSVGAGITYRKIQLEAPDYFQYATFASLSVGGYFEAKSNGQYQSVSESWGFYAESDRLLHKGKFFHGRIGLNSAWLIREKYQSDFSYTPLIHNGELAPKPLNEYQLKEWFLSSTYLAAFYRFNFTSVERSYPYLLDFSIKTSIGTNLYSDWDQFKRYVWIGVGAEIGIRLKKQQKEIIE